MQPGRVGSHQARDRQLASVRATESVRSGDADHHLMRAHELVQEDALRLRRSSPANRNSARSELRSSLLAVRDFSCIGNLAIRRECLDWLIPMTESHLREILKIWVSHYNGGRPQSNLGPGEPGPRNTIVAKARPSNFHHQLGEDPDVRSKSLLGGLHTSIRGARCCMSYRGDPENCVMLIFVEDRRLQRTPIDIDLVTF